jgi:CHASE1-domain containing sensor protein
MRRHHDLDVLAERHQEAHEPLDGKLPEIAAQHFGNVRLPDAEKFRRFDLFQAALLHQSVDPEDKLGLDQMLLGLGKADIF